MSEGVDMHKKYADRKKQEADTGSPTYICLRCGSHIYPETFLNSKAVCIPCNKVHELQAENEVLKDGLRAAGRAAVIDEKRAESTKAKLERVAETPISGYLNEHPVVLKADLDAALQERDDG